MNNNKNLWIAVAVLLVVNILPLAYVAYIITYTSAPEYYATAELQSQAIADMQLDTYTFKEDITGVIDSSIGDITDRLNALEFIVHDKPLSGYVDVESLYYKVVGMDAQIAGLEIRIAELEATLAIYIPYYPGELDYDNLLMLSPDWRTTLCDGKEYVEIWFYDQTSDCGAQHTATFYFKLQDLIELSTFLKNSTWSETGYGTP